ncbi:hypothetical protein V9T40_003384 [Parthenolecanium corni]|uniref:CRAL-TRIO domain-containing protein n=1 Tax=Parthenolecanium corni TaxID=536013 RepID=A0AAN9TV76_9HEMI
MTIVSLDQTSLDELDRAVAEKELRETPAIKQAAIQELRQLLADDKTLHYDDSDEFLQLILRPVKYYPESAHKLLQRIAEFKKKNDEVLQNVSPLTDEESFFKSRVLNVLVDRDQHRRRILTMCLGKPWDPRVLDTDKLFRMLYIIHYGALMEPKTQVHGTVIIMDFGGLSYSQAVAFTPAFSQRLLTFIQDAMPLRLKAVHIIFQPMVFKIVWSLFSRIIREKLRKRIHFHNSNVSSLHKHIDKSCLPEKYGGTSGKIDYSCEDWYPVIAKFEDTIKVWHSYGYRKD